MTSYVYGTERRDIGTRTFKNARFFQVPETDATHVVVIGNYPAIVAAYQALGVSVSEIPVGGRIPDPLPAMPQRLRRRAAVNRSPQAKTGVGR